MAQLALDLRSYPGEVRAHDHPHHQVILALEGALDMEIGRRIGRVDSACGALVPAGTMHAFAGIGRNRFVTLDIATASPAEPADLLASKTTFFAVPRAVEHLLGYVQARSDSIQAEMTHVAPLLAAALTGPSEGAMPPSLQRAIAFLRRAHRRPISCDDAAHAAGLSTARLHALFARWLGMGPGRYLTELRLGHARDRLSGGSDPIAAIALDAGFSEQSAFSRAFRRRYGQSPAAYRRRENRHKVQLSRSRPPTPITAFSASSSCLWRSRSMRLTDFKILTFDCYGTLIDWESGILAAMRPLLGKLGGKVDDGAALEAFARHESAIEAAEPALNYRKLLAKTYRALAQEWGARLSDGEAESFGNSVPDWPAFADSAASLAYLKRHYKLVILSNVDRASFAESNKKLGLTFDAICTAEDVGSYKPDRRNFEFMLRTVKEKLGASSKDILHTAQSLFHDHQAAKAMGLATNWIDRRMGKAGAGATKPVSGITTDFHFPSMAAFVEAHKKE